MEDEVGKLIHSLIGLLIHCFIDSFTLVPWLLYSMVRGFVDSFIHSFLPSFVGWLVGSFVPSFVLESLIR